MYNSSAFAFLPLILFASGAKAEDNTDKNLQVLPPVTCQLIDYTKPGDPVSALMEAAEAPSAAAGSMPDGAGKHEAKPGEMNKVGSTPTTFELREQPTKVSLNNEKYTAFAYFYVGLVRLSLVDKASRKDLKIITAPVKNFTKVSMNFKQPHFELSCELSKS